MEDKKSRRGGARLGAGRPKGDSKIISFRAPGPLAEQLEGMENRTEFIRQALTRAVRERGHQPGLPGPVVPASSIRSLSLPYYDISVVAGFPVPLDNDERSQDIDILSMLCPHPEASYLIRVSGNSMIDAGVLSGDIVIVDKRDRKSVV